MIRCVRTLSASSMRPPKRRSSGSSSGKTSSMRRREPGPCGPSTLQVGASRCFTAEERGVGANSQLGFSPRMVAQDGDSRFGASRIDPGSQCLHRAELASAPNGPTANVSGFLGAPEDCTWLHCMEMAPTSQVMKLQKLQCEVSAPSD